MGIELSIEEESDMWKECDVEIEFDIGIKFDIEKEQFGFNNELDFENEPITNL